MKNIYFWQFVTGLRMYYIMIRGLFSPSYIPFVCIEATHETNHV